MKTSYNNNPLINRGTILVCTSGKHEGDLYMLIRETNTAQFTDPTGTPVGANYCIFNLINLSNDGKARVSTPSRKLYYPTDKIPMSAIQSHFGMEFDIATHISKLSSTLEDTVDRLMAVDKTLSPSPDAMSEVAMLLSRILTSNGSGVTVINM